MRLKCSALRQFYGFLVNERWREDNSEHEHYSDSGGKSGGQKEKLAYTILAASLAYGAEVISIDGSFDDGLRMVREITERHLRPLPVD